MSLSHRPSRRIREVSMAHHGILFLYEPPEFTAQVLDSLRQPLEAAPIAT